MDLFSYKIIKEQTELQQDIALVMKFTVLKLIESCLQ
jgi:hypothetical protein